MLCFLRLLMLSLAVGSVTVTAYAEPAPAAPAPAATSGTGNTHKGENFVARPLAVYAHLSLGGPFGNLGASLDYSFSRYVSVEAGGGVALPGADIGVMLLPRLPLSRGFAIGAGVGLSGTVGYADTWACNAWVSASCTPPKWSFAPFANGEFYLEGRTGIGFSVRGYVGVWRNLKPTPDIPCQGCTSPDVSLPYVGVAFGWAIP